MGDGEKCVTAGKQKTASVEERETTRRNLLRTGAHMHIHACKRARARNFFLVRPAPKKKGRVA